MTKKRKIDYAQYLCKLGTVAHNRAFTAQELREYAGGKAASAVRLFKRKGWIGRGSEKGTLYPTKKGWRAIEIACALRRGK